MTMRSARHCAYALFLLAACAKPTGTLTVINLGDTPLRGNLADIAITANPGAAWSSDAVAEGTHSVILNGTAIDTTITAGKVTALEPSGTGCFVVANFRPQYGDNPKSDVLIEERFQQQKQFTLKETPVAEYGKKLPKKIPDGTDARRLHQVDCTIATDNTKVADAIMRVP